MLKTLQIVFTLALVVIVSTVTVFVVVDVTEADAIANADFRAAAALREVLPGVEALVDSTHEDFDLGNSGITAFYRFDGLGYVYQAEFQGYQSKIVYVVGVDENSKITGFKTLAQGDTPGLGAEIGNEENWVQFIGMDLDKALNGEFDGLTGATVTTGGWKASLEKVINFHNVQFEGVVVETPEEMLARFKEEITAVDAVITDVTSDHTLLAGVTKVEVANNGTEDFAAIITAEFTGYQSTVVYIMSFDLETGNSLGFRVVSHGETPGYGATIEDEAYYAQFVEKAKADIAAGTIDDVAGTSGAPVTMGAFKASLEKVVEQYEVGFEGVVVETEAEKLARWYEEITAVGTTFTDVTSTYTLEAGITKIETANNGTEDFAIVYHVDFYGYNAGNPTEYLVAIDSSDGTVLGLRVLYAGDTLGIGSVIADLEFTTQFINMDPQDVLDKDIDGVAAATMPITLNAFKDSFESVMIYHQSEFMGVSIETPEELLNRLITEIYPTADTYADVKFSYPANYYIESMYEVKDASSALLGYVFQVNAPGASYSETTYVQFLLGVNVDKTFSGFRMMSDNETPGKSDPYYLVTYASEFIGVDIESSDYGIDAVAGSTITHNKILTAAWTIANHYVVEVLEEEFARPEPVVVADVLLAQAYPGAGFTFNSVYLDYPNSTNILNVYEVLDGATVVGHVYVGQSEGYGGNIKFALGVNNAGTTQNIKIISESESWSNAAQYGVPIYNGSEGLDFPTTPWLAAQFDGKVLAEFLTTSTIDDVSGVSTTTGGLRLVAEEIAQFHSDKSVGGGS